MVSSSRSEYTLRSVRSFGFHCREGVEEGAIWPIKLTLTIHLHQTFFFKAISLETKNKQFDLYFGEEWGWGDW